MTNVRHGIQRYFRRSRMRWFVTRFDIRDTTRIVDIGGTPFNWDLIAAKPQVTMVNIDGEDWHKANLRYVVYDGVTLPFADRQFDVAYSNSVIEHVGDWSRIEQFSREIRRMAPGYYVQTPNRRFIVEPHIMGIVVHWFAFPVARRLVRYLSLWGLRERPSQEQIDRQLRGTHLLTTADMRRLFPDAEIRKERVLGMTKSIIAAKPPARDR